MPQRSAVHSLPVDIKTELDQWLVNKGFAGYEDLSQWLAGKGFSVSKSSLHRYGSAFEAKTEKLRTATQMSITLAEAVGDESGAMNDALIRMAQGEIFEILLAAEETGESLAEALPGITLAVSRLARASLPQKKWQAEIRKEERSRAAKQFDEVAKSEGMDEDQAKFWREKFLGIK